MDLAVEDPMAMKMALCPDNRSRPYTVKGDIAVVEVRGYRVEGKITEEDGITKFRQTANHHGAHLVWYPPRDEWERV